jgi:serine/threonine protein kinase
MVQAGFRADARLGPYFLVELKGGGMGQVWRAVHQGSGRPVAIKVSQRDDERALRAFQAEILTAASMRHPNIATVLEVIRVDAAAEQATGGLLRSGRPALVMEWVDGPPLSESLGKLPWDSVRKILVGLLDALSHAHGQGVLHRDIKPSNVLIEDGSPRLVDFGIARRYPGERSGTPAYMAPEQFSLSLADEGPWTDLYNLGCVAVAMITRSPPYGAGSWDEMAAAHRSAPIPRIDWGPPGLDAWVAWLLAKRPADRPQTAFEARAALMRASVVPAHRTATLDAGEP